MIMIRKVDACVRMSSIFSFENSIKCGVINRHFYILFRYRTDNERVVYKFDLPKLTFPIGITIDNKGNLYVGLDGDGKVVKIDPR